MAEHGHQDFNLTVPDIGPMGAGGDGGAVTEPSRGRQPGSSGGGLAALAMEVDLSDPRSRARVRQAVDTLGGRGGASSVASGRLLEMRVRALAQAGSDGTALSDGLQRLAEEVRELDPSRTSRRRWGLFGRRGDPMQDYLVRVSQARAEIDVAISTLMASAEALRQNDVALGRFDADIRAERTRLEEEIEVADDFEAALVAALDRAKSTGDDPARIRFVEMEVLFPLEQRRRDLQSLLALNQQAGLSLSILRETNEALVQHVKRTTQLTSIALDTCLLLDRPSSGEWSAREQVAPVSAAPPAPPRGAAMPCPSVDAGDRTVSFPQGSDLSALQSSFDQLLQTLEDNDLWRRDAIPRMRHAIDVLQDLSHR